MKKLLIYFSGILLLLNISVSSEDLFQAIKDDLASAACIELDFISITESDVFNTVDSVDGKAVIAADARYFIHIGFDTYLYDNKLFYTFSEETNQVVIEEETGSNMTVEEITFLKKLDKYFRIKVKKADFEYFLVKRKEINSELPESMTIYLDSEKKTMERIEFYDTNEDLNIIVIKNLKLLDNCSEKVFIPDFPKGAERIKL